MDTTQASKRLLQRIFDGLAAGDGKPFLGSLADDFCWHMIGSTAWSGSYLGKQAVQQLAVLHPADPAVPASRHGPG